VLGGTAATQVVAAVPPPMRITGGGMDEMSNALTGPLSLSA